MQNLAFLRYWQLSTTIAILTATSNLIAEDLKPVLVKSIHINGLSRTDESVVLRELLYQEGEATTQKDIAESIQRLKNLQLFASVTHDISTTKSTKYQSEIESSLTLEERWTTIPILKFSSGGGVSQMTIGAYDINLFGRYLEGGLQLEKLGNSRSAVVWYRNPRLFNNRLHFSIDLWDINRIRTHYQNQGSSLDIERGFLEHTRKAKIKFEKEWQPNFKSSMEVELSDLEYSKQYLEKKVLSATEDTEIPPNNKRSLFNLELKYGRLNYDSYKVQGNLLTLNLSEISDRIRNKSQGQKSQLEFKNFTPMLADSILAFQGTIGKTTSTESVDLFYAGGLNKIRGYTDDRFRGSHFWLTNSEIRMPSYSSSNLVLQHILFYDTTYLGNNFNKFTAASGASIGTGFRVIAPKIYRLVARLDIAHPLIGKDHLPISFGVQQFF
ncbi:MAG: BamA/TamA family outer membrane protein [Bdellovibrionota bacterium]